ncbi:putative LRR containing protein [Trachipleistophora hominis]|uniref:Putative LRR containing protein n=1 Tax=Trachipleistophora hominis TaxID=72359 RepID=L7JTV9_TRAHO|nr:putative LRR containing protein [Trachipleistophora hominis]
MPKTLKTFVLRRTMVRECYRIDINSDCMSITIDRAMGNINIPYIPNSNPFDLRDIIWSFERQKNENGSIDKLTISNYPIPIETIDIRRAVRVLILANIAASSESNLIIRDNIENAVITDFHGLIDLFGPNSVIPFEFYLNNDKLMLIKSKKMMVRRN